MTDLEAYQLISALAAPGSACWTWTGRVTPRWEPILHVDEQEELAHRTAYRLWRAKGHRLAGEMRPHVVLVRACGNSACVNPHHMIPADPRTRPSLKSPRGSPNRSKTCCPQGHPYEGSNLIRHRDGRRRCRACHRETLRRCRQRAKAKRDDGRARDLVAPSQNDPIEAAEDSRLGWPGSMRDHW